MEKLKLLVEVVTENLSDVFNHAKKINPARYDFRKYSNFVYGTLYRVPNNYASSPSYCIHSSSRMDNPFYRSSQNLRLRKRSVVTGSALRALLILLFLIPSVGNAAILDQNLYYEQEHNLSQNINESVRVSAPLSQTPYTIKQRFSFTGSATPIQSVFLQPRTCKQVPVFLGGDTRLECENVDVMNSYSFPPFLGGGDYSTQACSFGGAAGVVTVIDSLNNVLATYESVQSDPTAEGWCRYNRVSGLTSFSSGTYYIKAALTYPPNGYSKTYLGEILTSVNTYTIVDSLGIESFSQPDNIVSQLVYAVAGSLSDSYPSAPIPSTGRPPLVVDCGFTSLEALVSCVESIVIPSSTQIEDLNERREELLGIILNRFPFVMIGALINLPQNTDNTQLQPFAVTFPMFGTLDLFPINGARTFIDPYFEQLEGIFRTVFYLLFAFWLFNYSLHLFGMNIIYSHAKKDDSGGRKLLNK
jgi:hypothetical protein